MRNEKTTMARLRIDNVALRFGGKRESDTVTALERISLDVADQEFVVIVGPSGCGKSTFLHIIGGFELATAGEITLGGKPIGRPGPDRGMMFQELSLFPWLTAIENVAWPLEMKGLPKAERLAKAAAGGIVRYGLYRQDAAMMTCFTPSVMRADHVHFIDGARGGYASAATALKAMAA